MLLIADSGSTKCDWLLMSGEEVILETSTMGFNPYFHDEAVISGALRFHRDLQKYANRISSIFFYGAGCSSKELNAIVHRALKSVFPVARITVDHDLNGAAMACYDGEPGIACILGTGSNSCFFDGNVVTEEVPALAYILGDEGSGSYYGKQLLAGYLYKHLPAELHADFEAQYGIGKDEIMENVYMKPNANVYLASFMRFFSSHKQHPWVQERVLKGMTHFLKTHVMCYPNYREVPVNFVGSVAFYFEGILRRAAEPLGITVGRIVKKPIHGLAKYHQRYSPQHVPSS